ncbi:MAG: cation transporter [Flavobacteriia bacterium]|nr:MAG: cation transporter [Flavobacteriia bacterium]
MIRTTFKITKMDCPSEENLIRMKLNEIPGIKKLEFDIPNRKLSVYHENDSDPIENSIAELNLGGEKIASEPTEITDFKEEKSQRKLLWIVLYINFGFFIIEMFTGIISRSMGLVADSLDMLADSFVYGLSIYAVGGSLIKKKKVARIAGYFQIFLAGLGFAEVLRRFFGHEEMPDFRTMIIISVLALIANAVCLLLLQRSKSDEPHMQASMIFTSNDIIINLGVITAGVLVYFLNSGIPDLIIGTIVFAIVIKGALTILKLGK